MKDPFSMTSAAGVDAQAQPTLEDRVLAGVSKVGPALATVKQGAEDAKLAEQMEYTVDQNGIMTWKGPAAVVQHALGQAQKFGQLTQQYEKMLAENEKEQAQIKAHPFANALAQIGASVGASSKDPLVRGLGDAAQRLNPTSAQLKQEQMGLLQGAGQAGQHQASAYAQLASLGQEQQKINQYAEQEKRRVADLERKTAADKNKDLMDQRDKWLAAAGKGEAPPPAALNRVFVEGGMDPKVASAWTEAIAKTNEAALAQKNAEAARKDRHEANFERGILGKANEKSEADTALRSVAHSIATGDLTAMRDVSSFRGTDKSRIFQMIKEENPKFDMAEMQRKVKMVDSFTNGKDGQVIQSFDTFLQHAGEVTETIKGVAQSNTPALNKPMNWWKKNMAGSPEYQRLIGSLEPVKKEFESFLLNNRALYADDRKNADILLSGDSSPKQIMAAIGQMGQTAKDRYGAMNQRYKRVTGEDIKDPFSPAARDAAAKIGIDLPGDYEARGGTEGLSKTKSGTPYKLIGKP